MKICVTGCVVILCVGFESEGWNSSRSGLIYSWSFQRVFSWLPAVKHHFYTVNICRAYSSLINIAVRSSAQLLVQHCIVFHMGAIIAVDYLVTLILVYSVRIIMRWGLECNRRKLYRLKHTLTAVPPLFAFKAGDPCHVIQPYMPTLMLRLSAELYPE